MTETPEPESNQQSRLRLIDLFDFLLWVGIVLAGLTFKVWDPILIGWSLLLIGVAGLITKGIAIFVTRPKLILIEGLEYLCLAVICAIIFGYCLANCDVTLAFGIATVGAAVAGILILRKYLGKENAFALLLSSINQRKQNNRMLKPNFIKGGLILAGITLVIGLLWGPCCKIVGFMAYGLSTRYFLISLSIYFVLFIYGSLISFLIYKSSISTKKWVQTILGLFVFILTGFYLFALYVGSLPNS